VSSTQFSIRLPDEQKEFLDNLADATDRTRNQIISSAVGKLMENYAYVLEKIEQGEADVAAGRVFDTGEVERRTQAIIDQYSKSAGNQSG
jgi:predicted transcriptional regulator